MSVPSLWTEERVNETVTTAYVHSQLRPNEQELLQRTLYFGDDLTDDTYLERILSRTKRFFLILVAIGVPDQIFGIIDDSYDDEDLPIAEYVVPELRLSYEPDRSLDKRFYKTQFRFLTRVIGEGEHIRYADEETVPVTPLSRKAAVLNRNHEGLERVRLSSDPPRILLRRRIVLDGQVSEEDILGEIAASRKLRHEHIVSVFGSYLHQNIFNVLSMPGSEWNLRTFLTDAPKAFNNISKTEHRRILLNWPHCLASALAWLHNNGQFHGAIRPSNIHVDERFSISLGLLDGDGHLRGTAPPDDIEAYQYGPPERWKRAVTIHSTGSAAIALPSGGRSGRRIGDSSRGISLHSRDSMRSRSNANTANYTFEPASRGDYARLRLNAAMSPDMTASMSVPQRALPAPTDRESMYTQRTVRTTNNDPLRGSPSVISSSSQEGRNSGSVLDGPIFVSGPETRSAFVQTWQSVEEDMFASDVFSLGAVTMDIMNLLCKRSYSSFARHRSARNRMAGRGGGLADASYHANLGQVASWAEALEKEAESKVKKDESRVYQAVGAVLQLALQCLERDPSRRLTSEKLEYRLHETICHHTGLPRLHCLAEPCERTPLTVQPSVKGDDSSAADPKMDGAIGRQRQGLHKPSTLGADQQHHANPRAKTSRSHLNHTSSNISMTPGTASVQSLRSFSFDGLSETIVAESPRSPQQSLQWHDPRGTPATPKREGPWSEYAHSKETGSWTTWKRNASQANPESSSVDDVDAGAFTYINDSSSTSSEEADRFLPVSYSAPPAAAPDRALPAVPSLSGKAASFRSDYQIPQSKIARDVSTPMNPNLNMTVGGHPPRLDSLPKTPYYEENDHNGQWGRTQFRQRDAVKTPARNRRPRHGHD